jgi:hypothetical protein
VRMARHEDECYVMQLKFANQGMFALARLVEMSTSISDVEFHMHDERGHVVPQLCAYLPDGQITEFLSSPICKNIPLRVLPKSNLYPPPSRSPEGRFAIVTDAGRDAVDADSVGRVT